jgi:hypothetical protein
MISISAFLSDFIHFFSVIFQFVLKFFLLAEHHGCGGDAASEEPGHASPAGTLLDCILPQHLPHRYLVAAPVL